MGAICGHLTRFSYIPSKTISFICHELLKCALIVKNELLFLHISTLKHIGYGQVGATNEKEISIVEHSREENGCGLAAFGVTFLCLCLFQFKGFVDPRLCARR